MKYNIISCLFVYSQENTRKLRSLFYFLFVTILLYFFARQFYHLEVVTIFSCQAGWVGVRRDYHTFKLNSFIPQTVRVGLNKS